MKEIPVVYYIICLIAVTFFGVRLVDTSRYAEVIIDYVAFFGGIFLVIDALYRIYRSDQALFPHQTVRVLRAVIGTCIFAIHTLQFMR